MLQDLVDRFYEAAFMPDEWADVLDRTSATAGSAGGTLFIFEENAPPVGRTSPIGQELFDEFVKGDFWKACDSVQRMCDVQPGSFVNVDDYLSPEEIEQDPIRIKLRAAGIGSNLCTSIALPSGELVMFVFQRWLSDGAHAGDAIRLLNELRPDMARAGLVAARLRLERAKTTVAALEAIGLPAMTINAGGRVMAMNRLMEALSPLMRTSAFDKVSIANPAANELLQLGMQAAGSGRRQTSVRSIPLPAQQGNPAMVLHIIPLVRNAHDIFGADMLIAATAVTASSFVPDPRILTGLFDLTPAEAKLATDLVSGLSLQDAAAACGITFKTGRTYLERIFGKTGVHRQSELVALLKNAAPFSAV
jgi:DNA-binding CsgD family transcriptional regulator